MNANANQNPELEVLSVELEICVKLLNTIIAFLGLVLELM